jgi:hypothetical protein
MRPVGAEGADRPELAVCLAGVVALADAVVATVPVRPTVKATAAVTTVSREWTGVSRERRRARMMR